MEAPPADLGEYRKALARLANASNYLVKNYLEDERTEQALCLDKDHWAAINLVHDTVTDAMDLLKRPILSPQAVAAEQADALRAVVKDPSCIAPTAKERGA